MMRQTGNICQMVRQSRKVRSPSPILGPNDLRSSIGINMRQHKKFRIMLSALFAKWPNDCWSVFCQASVQKFPRGHIVYWNYISISKHNTWWMVMVLSERGWCCRFSCKGISVPNFPVVILCIGIILVFQNIIHGGW